MAAAMASRPVGDKPPSPPPPSSTATPLFKPVEQPKHYLTRTPPWLLAIVAVASVVIAGRLSDLTGASFWKTYSFGFLFFPFME